jgi:hypothetical protein
MSEWWTYTLQDFLLFSPRAYWRMVELHNRAVWPLQILALLLGAAILIWVMRPHPWSSRAISVILAVVWMWVAWAFLWSRYSSINWAAAYVVPTFALQALLLGWFGGFRGRVHFEVGRSASGAAGLMLFLYALLVHPAMAKFAGRPFESVEVFGIAPDPTVIATIGLATMTPSRALASLILIVPIAWCLVSWATLHAMGALEAWIPLISAGLAAAFQLRPLNLSGRRVCQNRSPRNGEVPPR